ncbi:MAG: type IV toxin-antitoxin system AbiEi family antitoxin domain-containing protein [bacterium]
MLKSKGNKLDRLLKEPSFTSTEAQAAGISRTTLVRYLRAGKLERIGYCLYRGTKAPKFDDFRWEDLYIATSRVKGGIICLISALTIYELTDEIPRQFWIAINHRTRHRSTESIRIVRMRNTKLGKTSKKFGTFELPIFDRERCIVDAFRYSTTEIAVKALKKAFAKSGKEKIDPEKLRKYAKALRINITPYVMAVTT